MGWGCGRHPPTETATEAGGTHLTGMHSCFMILGSDQSPDLFISDIIYVPAYER